MTFDPKALRRQIAEVPDPEERKAMLAFLAREEALDSTYRSLMETMRQDDEKRRRQIRKEKTIACMLGTPLAVFFGFYLLGGIRDGRIKNFIISGQTDHLSVVEYPYVAFAEEPVLFCILAIFYSVLTFAFGALALGIEHFGRKKVRSREEVSALIDQWQAERDSEKSGMVEVGNMFGQKMYSTRVDSRLAIAIVALLLLLIAYSVLRQIV